MKAVILYLPYLLSIITIVQMVLTGSKHPKAWALALANQACWLGWILASATWGLLPMNAALWFVCWRNHRLWNYYPDPLKPLLDLFAWAKRKGAL